MFLFKAVSGYGLAVIVIVHVIVNIRLHLFTFLPFHFFPLFIFPLQLKAVEKELQKLKEEKEISPCTLPAREKKFQISSAEEDQQYLNSIFERRFTGQEFVDYYD